MQMGSAASSCAFATYGLCPFSCWKQLLEGWTVALVIWFEITASSRCLQCRSHEKKGPIGSDLGFYTLPYALLMVTAFGSTLRHCCSFADTRLLLRS